MQLCRLQVERFRGIKSLDWNVSGRLVCLVGPGDATKTTILDAIGLVSAPRAVGNFVDADFFGAEPDAGFVIEATFTHLAPEMLDERKFGMELRGVAPDGTIVDELGDHEPALTIRLAVDAALDAQWSIISAANPDGRPVGPRDRALLGVTRVGETADREFTWSRGSTLARTMSGDDVGDILATAYREAQTAVDSTDLSALDAALERTRLAADQVGAGEQVEDLEVRLDLSPASGGALSLHTEGVPVARMGLGTRRLLAVGIQLLAAQVSSVVCVDEIEIGLEPHRLRQFLVALSTLVGSEQDPNGQVIFTTHAPTVLEVLGTDGLHVVRCDQGHVTVRKVTADLVEVVRAHPSALLARRVVVCEGRTEEGLLWGASELWPIRHESRPVSHLGSTFIAGGGRTVAPKRAMQLRGLGYSVLVLADSDEPIQPEAADLEAAGITVVQWADGVATEVRFMSDCSWEVAMAAAGFVADLIGENSVLNVMPSSVAGNALTERLGVGRAAFGTTFDSALAAGVTQDEFRTSFGQAAASKGWFKSIDRGAWLGRQIEADATTLDRDIGLKVRVVEEWCYARD